MGAMGKIPKEVKGMFDEIKGAIRGNYVFGIYPTRMRKGSPEGVDLLMELRPNEGNNPVASLTKLMGMIKKAFLPGDASVFESFHIAGAQHAYRLQKAVASLVRAGLKTSMKSIGGGADELLREKNLVFAAVGHNVLVATSEPVMRKAVAALKYGRSSLASDPKFSELAQDGSRPTQFVIAVSLTRTLNFVSRAFATFGGKNGAKSMAPSGIPVDMITGLLGSWPDPLMFRLSVQNGGVSARFFLPIGFDTLASFTQGAKKPSR